MSIPPSANQSSATSDMQEPRDLQEKGNVLRAEHTDEDQRLLRLGKKPVLKREFNIFAVVGFSCGVLVTWEGTLILCSASLLNGGPAGVLWGFLINWIGILSAFAVISELASIAPVAGGQFHWIALLSPPSSRKFLSYLTGWVTVIGWQATTVSAAFLTGSVIEALVSLSYPSYEIKPWRTLLITWAIVLYAFTINAISSRILARFAWVVLAVHLLGFLGILIPLVYLGPHGNASVFTRLNNGGGWSSNGLSFLVGLPSLVFSIFGADAVVHLSEEIQNASIRVPQALMFSLIINGAMGFAMMIALMFTLGNLQAALSTTIGYSFVEIFEQAVDSKGGAAAMAAVVLAIATCSLVDALATASRQLWAFSRENGIPFSKTMRKVYSRSVLPLNTILVTTAVAMLLPLIQLGSSVALIAVVDLSVAGLFASYLFCCTALLYRRLQGKIKPRDDRTVVRGPESLRWGPWRVPEPLGTINNAFACVYLTWTFFWTFWPPYAHITPVTMNYNVLVFGATVLAAIVWYFAVGRKSYRGPIIELELDDTGEAPSI